MGNQQTWIDVIQLPIFTVIITSLLTLSGALITQWMGVHNSQKLQQQKLDYEFDLERKRKKLESLKEMQKAMYTYYESHTKMEAYYLLVGRDVIKMGYSFNLKNNIVPNELALDIEAEQTWKILQNIYSFGKADIYRQLMAIIGYKRNLISKLSRIFLEQSCDLIEIENVLNSLRNAGVKGDKIFKEYENSLSEYVRLNF